MPPRPLSDGGELGFDLGQQLGRQPLGRIGGDLPETHLLNYGILIVSRQLGNIRRDHCLARLVREDGFDRSVEIQPGGRSLGGRLSGGLGRGLGRHLSLCGGRAMIGMGLRGDRTGGKRGEEKHSHFKIPPACDSRLVTRRMLAA